jgi:hypothetical protein
MPLCGLSECDDIDIGKTKDVQKNLSPGSGENCRLMNLSQVQAVRETKEPTTSP